MLRKNKHRVESMTGRDQELVFCVKLRQIETCAVYKGDFYSMVVSKKKQQLYGTVRGAVNHI